MIPLYDKNKVKGHFPIATTLLVLANIFIFFYTIQDIVVYGDIFGFSKDNLLNGRFYTLLTAMFLHANFWHLFGNLLFLWVFGENLEARLGSWRFLLFYLMCGMGAFLIYALFSNSQLVVIGASGAISGILGGYLVLFPKNEIRSIIPLVFFWTLASLPAAVFIIIWFLYQFFSLQFENVDMVAYSAHLCGFILGLLLVKRFSSRKKFF